MTTIQQERLTELTSRLDYWLGDYYLTKQEVLELRLLQSLAKAQSDLAAYARSLEDEPAPDHEILELCAEYGL